LKTLLVDKFEVDFDPFYGNDMTFENIFNMQKRDVDGNTIDVDVPKFAALLQRTTCCQRIEKLSDQYGKSYGTLDLDGFLRAQHDHAAMNPRVKKSVQENILIFRLFNEGRTGELSFNEIQDFVNDEVSMR
jgi:Ca2+-binding EF-hand superfamily protein